MNGLVIKEWLKEQGMRTEEFAVKLNVSYTTVTNLLAGKRVSEKTVDQLVKVTGIPKEQLAVS